MTEDNAAMASAQLVSTTGKAPAVRNASRTSGAGLSVTTTNGPCSAMADPSTKYAILGEPCQNAVNGVSTSRRFSDYGRGGGRSARGRGAAAAGRGGARPRGGALARGRGGG